MKNVFLLLLILSIAVNAYLFLQVQNLKSPVASVSSNNVQDRPSQFEALSQIQTCFAEPMQLIYENGYSVSQNVYAVQVQSRVAEMTGAPYLFTKTENGWMINSCVFPQ